MTPTPFPTDHDGSVPMITVILIILGMTDGADPILGMTEGADPVPQ